MTPKRPDDEITKIIYAGLTIEAGDMDKVIQQLKSLFGEHFKKLAHGAVPESWDGESDFTFIRGQDDGWNQAIDETHRNIDKIWEEW